MKKKLFAVAILCCVTIACVCLFAACDMHVHVYEDTVTAPTCIDKGYTTHTCECGKNYADNFVDATGIHDYASNGACKNCGYRKPSVGLEYYKKDDGTYRVIGIGTCLDKVVVIPSEIEGAAVTSIDNYAFENCEQLTDVIIPDSITEIGHSVFDGCTNFNFNVYDNARYVGNDDNPYYALVRVNDIDITSCDINDETGVICGYAFGECEALTSISIPDKIVSSGLLSFYGCRNLKGVYITDITAWLNIGFNDAFSNPVYYAHNLYLNGKPITDLVIPDGITEIGRVAFCYLESLTSLTISNSVTTICYGAFEECENLTSIIIPDSVTTLEERAFASCVKVTSIYIGRNVKSVVGNTFSDCSALEKIEVSEKNTKYHSVNNCMIETKTKTLLLGCKNSIIPNDGSVTVIGYCAFSGCGGLTEIVIPEGVTEIESVAFSGCDGLTEIVIPEGVESIGSFAASECKNLTNVTIPVSVTLIGDFAFYSSSLKNITFNGTKEQWQAIEKGFGWDQKTGEYTVHCTDGDIAKA